MKKTGYVILINHSSFWAKGIPTIMLIDEVDLFRDDYNNYIHASDDTLGLLANIDKPLEFNKMVKEFIEVNE